MTWTEIQKTDDLINDTKDFMIEQMKEYFECVSSQKIPTFILPDKLFMRIFAIHGKHSDCLGMEYGETPSVFPDDGDLYYISDFKTPNDMFYSMLEETKR